MAHHRFEPDRYHTTLGPHEPVLRIADGDTLATTSVDAGGRDADRELVTTPGNPMTGPFYVEGAEPGDTLAVHLRRLQPNRTFGYSDRMIAPNVVDPDYVPELPWPAEGASRRTHWHVDVEAWTATLVEPETKLGAFTLPLDPMVGCFGVAPQGSQAISTATSERHGGNMDYRGFVAGTTATFPVFEPGALLFIGDGHALQGDGEIVGSGIEISFDIELSVAVLKGRSSGWPRGENTDTIFTVGNARPLDQALQHATTEMLRWLQQDYGLDALSANILMSQCVEYDLGNVYDPAYTMVCKLPKRVLPPRASPAP
jgi:acetamidase/formamidase